VIRALIVDDEPLARDTVQLVLSTDPDVEVVGASSGSDAARLVAATCPDVMFLDVQMPRVDGFEVLAAIGPDAVPAIVFVTAYDHYAVRAFEVHALDYVLKPYDDRRLLAALARVKQRTGTQREQLAALIAEGGYLRRFIVRGRDKTVLVDVGEVDCLEAADDYVELHVGSTVHVMRERLAEIEDRLDPTRFARIHRSAIVNLERVREIHPLVRGDALVVLATGATFRLSRSRRSEFERRLSGSPRESDRSPQRR
jgi:two-component system LytT family response regulator